jgi:hypothetical protein
LSDQVVADSSGEQVEIIVRRRRTRRHRRGLLIRRVLVAAALAGIALGLSGVALLRLRPAIFHVYKAVEPDREAVEASRNLLVQTQQETLRDMQDRPVYPYSIVPGGVKDGRELKWAAEHDPVVAAHYAGFDYDNARVVRLVLERTVYLSYRIGNKVYWTRHRMKLKKGETVLTDGKMTARTKCGNRVEEMPQQATSSSEPPAAKFEEPVHPSVGTAVADAPVAFQSALLNRNEMPLLGPAPPLSLYDPFGNGMWVPISPPPLPGVCGVGKNKNTSGGKGKKGGNPCGNGGPGGEVPEPGTWLLVGTGLILMFWISRRRLARA